MSSKESYYAHGKLLLTAEYLILDGAQGIGLPASMGQLLEVESKSGKGNIEWTAIDYDESTWFSTKLNVQYLNEGDKSPEGRLSSLLFLIKQHSDKLNPECDYQFTTRLEFNRKFGLGSSSTLLYNLAQWSGLDPFALSEATFGGSGYDIACAGASGPILYQRTKKGKLIKPIPFDPPFKDCLFFAYSGRKQNSREGIANYRSLSGKGKKAAIDQASKISQELLKIEDLETFEDLLFAHEQLIGDVLGQPTILESEFAEFPGLVKSLGAWGGDFLLFTHRDGKASLEDYLAKRKIGPVFGYDELILK